LGQDRDGRELGKKNAKQNAREKSKAGENFIISAVVTQNWEENKDYEKHSVNAVGKKDTSVRGKGPHWAQKKGHVTVKAVRQGLGPVLPGGPKGAGQGGNVRTGRERDNQANKEYLASNGPGRPRRQVRKEPSKKLRTTLRQPGEIDEELKKKRSGPEIYKARRGVNIRNPNPGVGRHMKRDGEKKR